MSFFSRLSNGWELAKTSLKTVNENRSLLLFPVFSVISFILVLGTFAGGTFFLFGDQIRTASDNNEPIANGFAIGAVFLFYLINFFIIVYFNSALIYCAVKVLNQEETSLGAGLDFANSRIGKIFGWAVLSATVGTLLKFLQSSGKIGEIIASILGITWSVMTFFVVPVLIFEEKGVVDTVKESGRMMREKWGESITANVSFGLFNLLGVILSFAIGIFLATISPALGIIAGVFLFVLVLTVIATARTVFVAAVYNHVSGQPVGEFNGDMLDSVFIKK